MSEGPFTHPVGAPNGDVLPAVLQPEAMAILGRVHHFLMLLDPKDVEQRQALTEIQEMLRRYGFSSG